MVKLFEIPPNLTLDNCTSELLPMLKENSAEIYTGRRRTAIHPDKIVCTVLCTGAI